MKQYKGYYIDGAIFKSKADIDRHSEKQAVEYYKAAVAVFAEKRTFESSTVCEEAAERLVNNFGYTWEQLEEIEIEVMKAA